VAVNKAVVKVDSLTVTAVVVDCVTGTVFSVVKLNDSDTVVLEFGGRVVALTVVVAAVVVD